MPWVPKPVEVNGTTLHYLETGSGPPVLLLHGGMSDARTWGQQMEPLAERHRVMALSLRGHHPNPWPDDASDYTAANHARDVAAVIDTLALGATHIAGSSYGADIALLVARDRPEIVRSLVLGEPGLDEWIGPFDANADGYWQQAQRAVLTGDAEGGARIFIGGVVGEGAYDELPESTRGRLMDNIRLLTLSESVFRTDFTREDAAALRAPALLLQGDESPPEFLRVMDELALLMPGAEGAVIPETSHLLHSMNAAVYNQTVLDFWSRH